MAWTAKKIMNVCSRWYCPPVCQGQGVDVEYGYDSEGSGDAFMRVTYRDGTCAMPQYSYAELPANLDAWPDAWEEELPGEWVRVASAEDLEVPDPDSESINVGDWVVSGRNSDDIDVGQIISLDEGIGGQVAWRGALVTTWCPVAGQNDVDVFATREAADAEAARRLEATEARHPS